MKDIKTPIILLLIIAGAGGIFWSLSRSMMFSPTVIEEVEEKVKEEVKEEIEDEIVDLLNKLKKETAVDFSKIREVEFDWMSPEMERLAIKGKGFEAEEISSEEVQEIRSFFKNNGFEPDFYNMAAGTIVGATGYKKDKIICLELGGVSGGADGLERESVVYDTKVRCAQLSEEEVEALKPKKTDEQLIAEAFAEKYAKSVDEVELTVNKRVKVFAQGGVKFAGEIGGAMWLAYKEEESWKIIFDGQGTIPCEDIEPYDFPQDMVPECWDYESGQSITR